MNQKRSLLLALSILSGASTFAATSPLCPNQDGYYFTNDKNRNPNAGGFVSYSADVQDDDYVFIARTAAICDNAQISGRARIFGEAIVRGNAEVSGNAKIYGNAVVQGDSVVKGEARVYENARVSGSSTISGDVRIKGWMKIHNKNLSSGTYSAPQYTAQELENMRNEAERNAREQAQEQARQEAARIKQENVNRAFEIINLLDDNADAFYGRDGNSMPRDSVLYGVDGKSYNGGCLIEIESYFTGKIPGIRKHELRFDFSKKITWYNDTAGGRVFRLVPDESPGMSSNTGIYSIKTDHKKADRLKVLFLEIGRYCIK